MKEISEFTGDTEAKATNKYHMMCEKAGLRRPGQHARVLGGKYAGLESTIIQINWSDGEILMKRPDTGERWWSVAMCCILDPDYGPMPDLSHGRPPSQSPVPVNPPAAITPVSTHSPAEPPLAVSKINPVSEDPRINPKPQSVSKTQEIPASKPIPFWLKKSSL